MRRMSEFDSLTLALEPWFDTPLSDLPDAIRKRVVEEFFPMPWDDLSAEQRRSGALQMDYQHDPATEQDQQRWWDFWQEVEDLKRQIGQWEAVAAPTATERIRIGISTPLFEVSPPFPSESIVKFVPKVYDRP